MNKHHISRIVSLLLFSTILLPSLFSQIPDDFEFLDHRDFSSRSGAMKVLASGVLYVSHESKGTRINLAKYDNTLESPFPQGFGYSQSKLFEINDSIFQIVLYDILNWDVFAPGYIVMTFQNSEMIDMQRMESDEENFQLYEMERDTSGAYWAINKDGVVLIEKDSIQKLISNQSNGQLFSNRGNQYLYKDSTILYNDGNTLNEILTHNDNILGLKAYNQNNLILTNGMLQLYDSTFNNLLQNWAIPTTTIQTSQISILDDNIYLMTYESASTSNIIIKLNENGSSENVYSDQDSTEKITHLNIIQDSSFLVTGRYNFENLTEQIFLRNIPVSYEPDYRKTNLEVTAFSMTRLNRDTIDVIDTGSDTIHIISFDYDVAMEITNKSDRSIKMTDAFSSRFGLWYGPNSVHLIMDEELNAGNSINLETYLRLILKSDLSFLVAGIPGGDYFFNDLENRITPIEFLTETKEINSNSTLLFPNPVSDLLTLNTESTIYSMSIYTIAGQLVYHVSGTDISKNLDVSEYETGIYFIVVEYDDRTNNNFKFLKI